MNKIINRLPFGCKNWFNFYNQIKDEISAENKYFLSTYSCAIYLRKEFVPISEILELDIKTYAEYCYNNDIKCSLIYENNIDFLKARCFEEIYDKLPNMDIINAKEI